MQTQTHSTPKAQRQNEHAANRKFDILVTIKQQFLKKISTSLAI